MKFSKGFTLIELLVVIAIIGILAALVLVSLGNARSKAQDTRIKSDVAQLHTLAELMYDSNGGNYTGVGTCLGNPSAANCTGGIETSVTSLRADLASAGGALTAASTTTTFCAHSTLASDTSERVCVDSTGVTRSGTSSTTCTAATGLCQ